MNDSLEHALLKKKKNLQLQIDAINSVLELSRSVELHSKGMPRKSVGNARGKTYTASQIIKSVRSFGSDGATAENLVSDLSGTNVPQMTGRLRKLTEEGLLTRVKRGVYKVKPKKRTAK